MPYVTDLDASTATPPSAVPLALVSELHGEKREAAAEHAAVVDGATPQLDLWECARYVAGRPQLWAGVEDFPRGQTRRQGDEK